MPIYEFYCPDNHRIYQFYARTLAQGRTVPPCPHNPKFAMKKVISPFAVVGASGERQQGAESAQEGADGYAGDERMEAATGQIERELAGLDENDPRAMGRLMRRMSELSGEKMDLGMEEVVRKLEEGADPDSLDEQLGAGAPGDDGGPPAENSREGRHRFRGRRRAPMRDPRLHDYP